MKTISALALAATLSLTLTPLAAKTFNFNDPKGVNNIAFHLDAPLEMISGTGDDISGSVSFDPDEPAKTTGTIKLQTASLQVPNPTMEEHLLGEGWLNAEKYPEILFETKHLMDVKQDGEHINAKAHGTLTLHGVSKEMMVPVKLTYLPGKLAARSNGKMEGDLLVIRGTFTIERADFDIKPGQNTDKVSETIELRLSLVGYTET